LVDLLSGRRSIKNKWVLKIKRKTDGLIECYKARLVVKGYTQEEGIDYEDTFSPVVRITLVRLILAILAHMYLELYQMDVRTMFLSGEQNKDIYMDKPLGFETKGQERKICKLKRSIYGFKQASRQWNVKFHQAILKDGFTMMEKDHCIYLKCSNNSFIILSLYVDDILITGNSKEMINTTKKWLSSNFNMKDMGKVSYVLGVKIIRDLAKWLVDLTQENYIKKMLEHYHMQDCKPTNTYVDRSLSLSRDMFPKTLKEKEKMSKVPYASVVGSLMYAIMCTHPDICYIVGLVIQYQSNPGQKL